MSGAVSFFFQAEDGIRDYKVTGVQTCALPIFVDSLRVDTADATRMAATRADRSAGNYTVFENGVYTACAPCKDDPKKPPLWQVKGARIQHDPTHKMMYFAKPQRAILRVPMADLS